MSKPNIRIHNAETDEVIDREMTDDEFQNYEAEQAKIQEEIRARTSAAIAKAALLQRLGITEEEAKLLLG